MHIRLHKLHVCLQSEAPHIQTYWQNLFAGWEHPPTSSPPDIFFTLSLTNTLPMPEGSPFFSAPVTLPDEVGTLAVYSPDPHTFILHYAMAAQITAHFSPNQLMSLSGVITPQALAYGRFEDILFTSLAPLLRRHGYYLLHAFAAVRDGQAVLLVGPSGSGKTTTGLALLPAGWELLANDAVLLEERHGRIEALPMPGTISIRPKTLALLPYLRWLTSQASSQNGKLTLQAYQLLTNGRLPNPAPVTAVYFPQISSQPTTHRQPQHRAISLVHLMEESVDRWDEACLAAHIGLLERLSQQADTYRLLLGQDMATLLPAFGEA